jgi:hypothetical protein
MSTTTPLLHSRWEGTGANSSLFFFRLHGHLNSMRDPQLSCYSGQDLRHRLLIGHHTTQNAIMCAHRQTLNTAHGYVVRNLLLAPDTFFYWRDLQTTLMPSVPLKPHHHTHALLAPAHIVLYKVQRRIAPFEET